MCKQGEWSAPLNHDVTALLMFFPSIGALNKLFTPNPKIKKACHHQPQAHAQISLRHSATSFCQLLPTLTAPSHDAASSNNRPLCHSACGRHSRVQGSRTGLWLKWPVVDESNARDDVVAVHVLQPCDDYEMTT
jgi:hypothetical protein